MSCLTMSRVYACIFRLGGVYGIENCLIVLEPLVEGLWEHMYDVGNLNSI